MTEQHVIQLSLDHDEADVLKVVYSLGIALMGWGQFHDPAAAHREAATLATYIAKTPRFLLAYESLRQKMNVLPEITEPTDHERFGRP